MSAPASAAERRRSAGAAVAALHPRWHGIRHPELIPLPPRRFSRLDMRPAVERGQIRGGATRAERSRDIVAAHPRWRGIKHPDRIFFGTVPEPESAILSYRAALRIAAAHVRESEELCRRIEAVADRIDRRSWPWGAAPSLLEEARQPGGPRRRPRLPTLGRRAPRPRSVRPAARLLTH